MTNLDNVIDRFNNMLTIKKQLYLEEITAKFTEREIKEIIYLLGELKEVRKQYDRSDEYV